MWSNNLEIDAKKYADFLASKDMFKHSEDLNELSQGENLYSTAYFVFQENGEKYFFENTDYLENASISWLNEKKISSMQKLETENNFKSRTLYSNGLDSNHPSWYCLFKIKIRKGLCCCKILSCWKHNWSIPLLNRST